MRRQIPGVVGLEIILSASDQLNHQVVRGLGALAKREDAVVHQNHADGLFGGLCGKAFGTEPGQIETGHHVGDNDHLLPVDLPDARQAVVAVGDRHHGIGMGVVNVLVGQGGVQDRLNRRGGGGSQCHAGFQLIDHLRVGQALQPGQF